MPWEIPGRATPIVPRDCRGDVAIEPAASSDRLGWVGLGAARFVDVPGSELDRPALTHHAIILFDRPPGELELRCEGVSRHAPPPAGSVTVVPAGLPSRWRWAGPKGSLHVFLEPRLVARVAAESFGLDPERWTLPPLDGLDSPPLNAVLRAVDAELSADEPGGALVAESLANLLAVHLVRHASGASLPEGGHRRDGALPRGTLRAVVDYIEDHLDAGPTLAEMAAVAGLSPYHFARRFKAATGLPPHQFVIARKVERARQLLGEDGLSLAQVAARAGFADQSQLTRHFKHLVGVTPGRFRTPDTSG